MHTKRTTRLNTVLKRLLQRMMLVLLATVFVACEDVVLPDKPLDTIGSTSDTTDADQRDSSNTADSTDRDTVRTWTRLEVSGPIINNNPNSQIDIEDGFVLVLWESGVGRRTVWGHGKILERGKVWKVIIEKPLPDRHWVKPEQRLPNEQPVPPGLYGMGTIVISNTNFDDGKVFEGALPYPVEFWGQLETHRVIFDPGESRDDPAADWLDPFQLGYNMALPMNGTTFVPDNEVHDPYTITVYMR